MEGVYKPFSIVRKVSYLTFKKPLFNVFYSSAFIARTLTTLTFLFIYFSLPAKSLQKEADTAIQSDTSLLQSLGLIKRTAELEQERITANYQSHSLILDQSKKFIALSLEIQNTRHYLNQGFEYKKVLDLIEQVKAWKEIAIDGVIINKDSLQTNRNLTATSILLKELVSRTNIWLTTIYKYHSTLGMHQRKLDSLAKDNILYKVPEDSAAAVTYFHKLLSLKKELDPVNADLKSALDSIQRIEFQVNFLKTSLESDISETEALRKQMDDRVYFKELKSFNQSPSRFKTLSEIIEYSRSKANLLIVFYIANHLFKIMLMLLSVVVLFIYLRFLVHRSKNANVFDQLNQRTQLLNYPVASAILISFTIFQFFLPLPPFIITSYIWLISSIALTVILRKSMPRFWFYTWTVFQLLFVIALFDNYLLAHSVAERWLILYMSIIGLATGLYFILSKKGRQSKDKMVFALLIIMALYEIGSISFNLYGNYNFAKGLMANGFSTFVVAFMVFWTIRLASDTLNISLFFRKSDEDDRHVLPLDKIGGKLSSYKYILVFIAWFVLLSRNTHAYQSMFGPLGEALKEPRSIGEFEFTYLSVFIFFFVIFLSGVLAKVVSFITSGANPSLSNSGEKGPGSWLLLVRIAIISAGAIIAFIAAGIPMDRLAIIIGALSVGIGFGLQTLINNLVSGLIIAFEKPINVGDIVEISGSIGKMKSIGIRSSVISTWDGSDVIIPNGDLLSQHLVNWTMGNTKRRFEIPVSVAYGTNLEETKKMLHDLILQDDRIMKNPDPIVWVTTFNNSSIDFVLKFWVANFAIGFDVKSDLMLAIDKLFKENGIVIPFPQQDIYIKSMVPLEGKTEDE